MDDLLKDAIADAKAVRETALANAKMALEEAFTPQLKSMLSKKIQHEIEDEDEIADADEMGHEADEMGHADEEEVEEAYDEGEVEDGADERSSVTTGGGDKNARTTRKFRSDVDRDRQQRSGNRGSH